MKKLLALISKDFRLEFRTREVLVPFLSLFTILAVSTALGLQTVFIDQQTVNRLFPVLFFLIFIFSSTVASGRNFENEISLRALDGLLVTGTDPALIFISKFFSLATVNFFGGLVFFFLLSLLIGTSVSGILGLATLIILVTSIGLSALATLLCGVSAESRIGPSLLPLLLIPLALPLIAGGIELMSDLMAKHSLALDSSWLLLLYLIDLVYLLLGINLYQFVVKE